MAVFRKTFYRLGHQVRHRTPQHESSTPGVPTLSQWVPAYQLSAVLTLAPALAQCRWYVHKSRKDPTSLLRSEQCLKRLTLQATRSTKQTHQVCQGGNRAEDFTFAHEANSPQTQVVPLLAFSFSES